MAARLGGSDVCGQIWFRCFAEAVTVTASAPAVNGEHRLRRPQSLVVAAGLALAAVIAVAARWGPDWPAQEFRAWSARYDGLAVWTNRWYSGQALPGYSVIYPMLSARLGAAVTGVAAVAAATFGAARMAPLVGSYRRIGYLCSVALVLAADLLIGQVPYLVGVAFGVWSFWAVQNRRPVLATLLAAASGLSSPLTGAFLLLVVPAAITAFGWRRAAPFAAGLAGIAVSVSTGGSGGPFPFTRQVFAWTAVFAALCVILPTREHRALRILGLSYGLAAVLLFAVANPIGGNFARLGQLLALPLAWHALPTMRKLRSRTFVIIALAALWPTWPALTSIAKGAADPSQRAAYYRDLVAFLHTEDPTHGRLEIVFTREHWESSWVARAFPLARGWERQTDMRFNSVLYRPLSSQTYRRWLSDNGVSLVALPNVPIDYGGTAESLLLEHPPSYLSPVWHDRNIRVWRVRAPHPLATGSAQLTSLGAASFALDFRSPGSATVRIHSSAMWAITAGRGCVSRDRHGWLVVTSRSSGSLTVRARLRVTDLATTSRCS